MSETIETIYEYLLNVPKFTAKPTLAHTKALLARLGHPEASKKIIHVAGTNGKGSVCNYMTQMLLANGKTVGTFTSPHLVDMRERICIQGEMAPEEVFEEAFYRVKESIGELTHPSFFEFLFLMAMVVFDKSQVEYVVLEVGLGGRLDATNAIENPAVSIITSISLDHTEILGDTVEQIAGEKAGIIKPRAPVFFDGSSGSNVSEVIMEKAKAVGTKAIPVYEKELSLAIPGAYQKQNASLAWEAYLYLAEKAGFASPETEKKAMEALCKTRWRGRMEEILPGVYLDGAHNEDAMKKFVATVRSIPCSGRRLLLYSGVREKNLAEISKILIDSGLFDKIYLTELPSYRRATLEELAAFFASFGRSGLISEKNLSKAYQAALQEKKKDDILFCTGSLYLVGNILGWTAKSREVL